MNDHPGRSWAWRLAFANSIGFSATTILPLWIAALPVMLGVSAWRIGAIGTAQLVACGAANLATPWLARARSPLAVARLALAIAAAGSSGEALALGLGAALPAFAATAIVAGIGFGMVLAMTNRLMAGSAHAQHGYAIFQIVEVCFASSLFVIGARLVQSGGSALFALAAGLCLAGLVALVHLPALPPGDAEISATPVARRTPRLAAAALLAAILCFFAGQSSINSFLLAIGRASGWSDAAAARIIASGMVCALAGATAARLLGERLGTIRPLALAAALLAADFLLITHRPSPAIFAIGAILVSTGTIFVVPYFFTALARMGGEGRYAALGPAFLIGGVSLGPLVGGLVDGAAHRGLLGWIASLLVAVAIALVTVATVISGRQALR